MLAPNARPHAYVADDIRWAIVVVYPKAAGPTRQPYCVLARYADRARISDFNYFEARSVKPHRDKSRPRYESIAFAEVSHVQALYWQ
jgi:hypothetical protein